tara:strand:- start:3161 stop:3832 length:672 start_codon:yes stop_codon:yes gene_type:complete
MQNKPRFHADAVILIDVWGAEQYALDTTITNKYDDDVLVEYMQRYQKNCYEFLQTFDYDYLLSATYRNGKLPAFSNKLSDQGIVQGAEYTPMHHLEYACQPQKLYSENFTITDLYKLVQPRSKIVVGGGNWGACLHYRPLGMVKLKREGFRVFTSPQICYGEPVHNATGEEGVIPEDLLWDDIAWSRCSVNDVHYDTLYEGIAIHPDNSLGRINGLGVPLKDT